MVVEEGWLVDVRYSIGGGEWVGWKEVGVWLWVVWCIEVVCLW